MNFHFCMALTKERFRVSTLNTSEKGEWKTAKNFTDQIADPQCREILDKFAQNMNCWRILQPQKGWQPTEEVSTSGKLVIVPQYWNRRPFFREPGIELTG